MLGKRAPGERFRWNYNDAICHVGADFDLYGRMEAGASVFAASVRFVIKGEEDVYDWCLTQLCWITADPLAGTRFQHGIFCSWTQFLSASGLHPSTFVTEPSAYCFDYLFGTSHWLNAHNDCLKQEFGWWLVSISHVYGLLSSSSYLPINQYLKNKTKQYFMILQWITAIVLCNLPWLYSSIIPFS